MPLISFCIVTYNHEDFIYKALQSIINSKFDCTFEIIVGNDCSTDNTLIEIKRFLKDYPGNDVTVINRLRNVGFMDNYFDILSKGEGQYFLCLDGDDYLEAEAEGSQVSTLLENQDRPLLFSYRIFDSNSNTFRTVHISRKSLKESLDGVFFHYSSIFVPRRIIKMLLSYKWLHEFNFIDRPLQIDIMREGRFHIIDMPLSVYRQHSASMSKAMSDILILKRVTKFIALYFGNKKSGMLSSEKRVFLKRILANYKILYHPANIKDFRTLMKKFNEDFHFLRENTSTSFTLYLYFLALLHYPNKIIYLNFFKKRKINLQSTGKQLSDNNRIS